MKKNLKGLIIHIGEYLEPHVIDPNLPEKYKIKYAKFNQNGKISRQGRIHRDPEFNTFTYGDFPEKAAKANLGELGIGDYIFFNSTFIETVSWLKARYIVGYFKLKEILSIKEIFDKNIEDKIPYCHNEHVINAKMGIWTLKGFLFVGDEKESKQCKIPLKLDKKLIEKIKLKDSSGELISKKFGKKRNKHGRLLSDIEIISSYTRNPKLIDQEQVETILRDIEK